MLTALFCSLGRLFLKLRKGQIVLSLSAVGVNTFVCLLPAVNVFLILNHEYSAVNQWGHYLFCFLTILHKFEKDYWFMVSNFPETALQCICTLESLPSP